MPEEKIQLSTFLFARIVGFNVMNEKWKKKAPDIISQQKITNQQLIEKHNGKLVKEIGDGILARFDCTKDAVDCALEMQRTDIQHVEARIRIGIHTGTLNQVENGNLDEETNIALRLQSITDPGGIYVSEPVKMDLKDYDGIQVKFLGEIRLKNILYGVNTYALQGKGLPVPEIKNSTTFSGRFWAELHRRNVLRAGVTYVLISFMIILMIQSGSKMFDLPQRMLDAMSVIIAAGLPLALILAWKFERSPRGFVRTTSKESWRNPYQPGQRKPFTSEFILLGFTIILVIIYFVTK
jgi:class 3 adenylate cyclase